MQSRSPFKRLVLEAADDLEVRVQFIRRKVPVAPVQATEPGLDQLDVLLRHRPLSISRQTVAFHARREPGSRLGSLETWAPPVRSRMLHEVLRGRNRV